MELPYLNKFIRRNKEDLPEISREEFFQNLTLSRAEAEAICSNAEDDLKRLDETKWSLKYTSLILGAALVINLGLMFAFTWKFYLYWIMAAFVFLMVNPFLTMLPTDMADLKMYIGYIRELKVRELTVRERKSRDGIAGEETSGKEASGKETSGKSSIGIADTTETIKGLTRQRNYLLELGWNLFFINCQPLAPGFLMLFALSAAFALAGWAVFGQFEAFSSIIITVQSIALIVFYIAIVHVKPYSSGFFSEVLGIHSTFKEHYEEAWSKGLKFALTAAVLITVTGILLIAALVLPGITYGSFTSAEADVHINIGIFALIFLSQMIAVRHFQGRYSRTLAETLLKSKIVAIREEILPAISTLETAPADEGVTPQMKGSLKKIGIDLIRHRMLKIDYRSLFGYFPVCLINPDIGAVMSISGKRDSSRTGIQEDRAAE
ncbi:hypothetical protein FTO68_02005 [Methanocalculus taiwanensis]|uniref:DUF2868 domain-containing protein n=1 Tax=Methanocalculus taiwanensis TaxID=106207 RepID=A0ABD4THK5_9EURY|nr:hypothetical protein [Methanocalculus taiwanensis]MCQ1537767.1 hypothetical protein [Methanocalculus taiwanensis]